MKNNKLFQTNLLISGILIVGFLVTAVLGYHVGHQSFFRWPACVSCLAIAGVMLVILVIINTVIRRFNTQVTELVEERQAYFKKATEQLYESIYEMNLTRNCYVRRTTEKYFESLGAGGMPFDKGLRVIAEKQIKEEFRDGYIAMFSPEHAIREYEAGNQHLRYDFMISEKGEDYHWMRVDAYLFYSEESRSIHMFAYRKNIDREKRKELLASTDEMTGLLSKKVTERLIRKKILKCGDESHAFFIFDIDNFKQVNDSFGHSFGDSCICKFANLLRECFQEGDILGRIGGDEFVAFVAVSGREQVEEMAETFSRRLNLIVEEDGTVNRLTASQGIALYPEDGRSFEELYRRADEALYRTKEWEKSGYTIREPEVRGDWEERTRRTKEAMADSRAAVMLSQVQPHFLYNSLIGIKQLCDTEPGKASDALQHFCNFLKQNMESLSDRNLIPFEREMAHVQEFLYLEQMRFGERVKVETEILESDFRLPSLTLQPMVENAVHHGIMKKKGSGTVTIKTEKKEDDIVITIADDGAGFDVHHVRDDGRMHLGIANVRKRLEIQCGGSLLIESEVGTGTVVTMILPQRRNGI